MIARIKRLPGRGTHEWARGELNHSTHASYLGLYAKPQVSAVVVGRRRPFGAVAHRTVMPRGITDDLAGAPERSGSHDRYSLLDAVPLQLQ
jgi:hypothetical protein